LPMLNHHSLLPDDRTRVNRSEKKRTFPSNFISPTIVLHTTFAIMFKCGDVTAAEAALAEIRGLGPHVTVGLKTLKVLIKNVAQNPEDEKFQTIKLTNPKIQERLGCCPQNVQLLKAMGFKEVDGTLTISQENINQPAFLKMQKQLEDAVEARSGSRQQPVLNAPCQAKKRTSSGAPKVSMKVQARRDAAEREKTEKAQRLADKNEQLKLIKAQAFARKNDPNWKAGVSAAMAKGGDAIETFRGKFGEDGGG